MLTVLCVRYGTKYSDEYVLRLQVAVQSHLALPHEFICLTNRPVPEVKCLPLPSGLPGWWSKVGLFRPGIIAGPKLYFDLDVVVTGPLDVFVPLNDCGKVWALDDFSYSLRHPKDPAEMDSQTHRLLGGVGTCNSSVMFWRDDVGEDVWHNFRAETMERLHGDQNHLTQVLWPDRLALYPPDVACSYKYHVMNGNGFGSLVVFHGQPKVTELEDRDSIKQRWLNPLWCP